MPYTPDTPGKDIVFDKPGIPVPAWNDECYITKDMLFAAFVKKSISNSNVAIFNDGAESVPLQNFKVDLVPLIKGTGIASLSNQKAIVGYQGLNIFRRKKNLFDRIRHPIDQGNISSSTGQITTTNHDYRIRSRYQAIQGNRSAVLSWVSSIATRAYFYYYDFQFEFISSEGWVQLGTDGAVCSVPEGCSYIRFVLAASSNIDITPSDVRNVQLEYGTVKTEYQEFEGNNFTDTSYDISWKDSVGTVYFGTLEDNKNGTYTLTSTHTGKLVSGNDIANQDPAVSSADVLAFYMTVNDLPNMDDYSSSIIASNTEEIIQRATQDNFSTIETFGISGYRPGSSVSTTNFIYFGVNITQITSVTNLETFRTWLNSNKPFIVYPIKNPIVQNIHYQSVETYLGDNVIFTTNQGNIDLTYCCDPTAIYNELKALI